MVTNVTSSATIQHPFKEKISSPPQCKGPVFEPLQLEEGLRLPQPPLSPHSLFALLPGHDKSLPGHNKYQLPLVFLSKPKSKSAIDM